MDAYEDAVHLHKKTNIPDVDKSFIHQSTNTHAHQSILLVQKFFNKNALKKGAWNVQMECILFSQKDNTKLKILEQQ